MEAAQRIGVVIVGAAGNRGRSALEILPKLRAEGSTKGIHVELVCLAEANEERRAELAAKATALLGSSCPAVGMLSEAIPQTLHWMEKGDGSRKLIVYDASPTIYHYMNLMLVLPYSQRAPMYYFGEKPLFTKEGQVEFVGQNFARATFFCELIETESPAFRAAKEFIRGEGLKIERMDFWRASGMGIMIAAGEGRGGVEGGALLDKAPHDLSVAVGLAGAHAVRTWNVGQVRTHLLALHEEAFRGGRRSFLSLANTPLTHLSARIAEQVPAEALVSFDVELGVQGAAIPASFLASWVGVQNTRPELMLGKRLADLGIVTKEWVNSEERQLSRNGRYEYQNQEVRVAVVEGRLRDRKVHLVLNLLAKFEGRRFVCMVHGDGQRETIFEEPDGRDYHESKDEDLFAVFGRVIEHCAGRNVAENVATEASLLVHRIMLRAMTRATEELRALDQDAAYHAALKAYGKYLGPARTRPSAARV